MIEQQVEHWIVAGQGERSVEETPSGAAMPSNYQDRMAYFMGLSCGASAPAWGLCSEPSRRDNLDGSDPHKGGQGMPQTL